MNSENQGLSSVSYSVIDKLNDDCLIYIFNLISVVDRIKNERVCKRWQEVIKQS